MCIFHKAFSMRNIVLIICLITFPILILGQEEQKSIDSLQKALEKSLPDSVRLQSLRLVTRQLLETDPEQAIRYGRHFLNLSIGIKDVSSQALANQYLGIAYHKINNYNKADSLLQQSLAIYESLNDLSGISKTCELLGLVDSDQGLFDLALIHFFKTLSIHIQENDSVALSGTLNKIGREFNNMGEFAKGRNYFLDALSIQNQIGRNEDYPHILDNLGLSEYHAQDYLKSLSHLEEAERVFLQSTDLAGLASTFYHQGLCYTQIGNSSRAFETFARASEIKEQLNDKRGVVEVMLGKARVYLNSQGIQEALLIVDSALVMSYLYGMSDVEQNALLTLADIRHKMGQHDDRAQLLDRYIRLTDSLNAIQNLKEVASAENNYILSEKQRELDLLSQQERLNLLKARKNRIIASFLLVFLFVLALFLFIIIRRSFTIRTLNQELNKHKSELEQMIKERTLDLEIAIEQAQQSDKLKSYFLGNLSHEIRTPLNGIMGFAELLLEANLNQPTHAYANQILDSGEQLLSIIDRILQLSKLQAGTVNVSPQTFDPIAMLRSMHPRIQTMSSAAESSVPVVLKVNPSSGKPIQINSDQNLIMDVLFYLINNSIKFTDTGKITYGFELSGNTLKFYVKDTGIGIAPDNIERIFTPFDPVEDVLTKTRRGVGLGIPLSSQIIRLLGSELKVSSEPGKGSTFTFAFPVLET